MMQLICNGIALDLYENTGLKLTHDNPLFAFDNLKCERTTEFKLPCTATNDAVLSCAKIPEYSGEGMRRKFNAVLIDGLVQKTGYLYVSSFDGKDYKAVFVTGELIGLQAIKNLGKLKDIISFNDYVIASQVGNTPSSQSGVLWANVSYRKQAPDTILHPSIELNSLYEAICTQYGITSAAIPTEAENVRIVAGELKGADDTVTFNGSARSMAPDAHSFPVCYVSTLDKLSELFTVETADVLRQIGDYTPYTYYSGAIQQFVTKQDIEIEFPEDWDDDIFIGYFIGGGIWELEEFEFLGNRSFDAHPDGQYPTQTKYVITGESLRGRKVTIEQGNKFVFIDMRSYVYHDTSSGEERGWDMKNVNCNFRLTSETEQVGAVIRLQDNLPDINFVELLKTIAAVSGKVLNYSDENGITFEDLDFTTYPILELNKIIQISEVKRTFADYAQNNYIRFDGETNRLQIVYTVDNENIDEEKELQVLPYAEGENHDGELYIASEEEMPVLGNGNGGLYLEQITLRKCEGLQMICYKSTQVSVSVRMTLLEYERIIPKSVLLMRNTKYVWASSSLQNETAKFTLQKIA